MTSIDDLRYPIGPFVAVDEPTPEQLQQWIDEIAALPAAMRRAVEGLSADQLEAPYREGGWKVRQVVHHVPDSHMNSYVRFKLALTENTPTIKPYEEARWAQLPDSVLTPVSVSLDLLEALHARWVTLLRTMTDTDFARGFYHPEHGRVVLLGRMVGLYAWHGKHHVAHITRLRERMGW